MASLVPVDGDPFAAPGPRLTPVDGDPFAPPPAANPLPSTMGKDIRALRQAPGTLHKFWESLDAGREPKPEDFNLDPHDQKSYGPDTEYGKAHFAWVTKAGSGMAAGDLPLQVLRPTPRPDLGGFREPSGPGPVIDVPPETPPSPAEPQRALPAPKLTPVEHDPFAPVPPERVPPRDIPMSALPKAGQFEHGVGDLIEGTVTPPVAPRPDATPAETVMEGAKAAGLEPTAPPEPLPVPIEEPPVEAAPNVSHETAPPAPATDRPVEVGPEIAAREGEATQGTVVSPGAMFADPTHLPTGEAIDAMIAEKGMSDDAKLLQVLGTEERVKRFKRLERLQDSSNTERADQAAADFYKEFGDLTEEQERIISNVGDMGYQVDDLKELRNAVDDTGAIDGPQAAADQVTEGLRNLGRQGRGKDIFGALRGDYGAGPQAAAIRIARGQAALREGAPDPGAVDRQLLDAFYRAGFKHGDAEEMLASYMVDLGARSQGNMFEPYQPRVLRRDPSGRPIERAPAPTLEQTERLLQGMKPAATVADVRTFAADLKSRLGLQDLSLFPRKTGDLVVNMIVVPKGARSQGIGTAAMQAVVDYADQHGMRVVLSPETKGGGFGTTSRNRLVQFYKKLGFVENKGRNKDFRISEGMYRDPVAQPYRPDVVRRDPSGRPLEREPAPTAEQTARLERGIVKRAPSPPAVQRPANWVPPGGKLRPSPQAPSGGGRPPPALPPPQPPSSPGSLPVRAATRVWRAFYNSKIVDDFLMNVTPMGAASGADAARAVAKAWANAERQATAQWIHYDRMLTKEFPAAERRAMWDAMDEQSVAAQREDIAPGEVRQGTGWGRLTPRQLEVAKQLDFYAQRLWNDLRDHGMVEGDGIPHWTPRMLVRMAGGKAGRVVGEGGGASSDGMGAKLRTSSPHLKHREHLTAEETEAAARYKLGEDVMLARDVRAMPLAMRQIQRALAGRKLVDAIKEMGQATGQDLVRESDDPGYFTIDHPSLKNTRARIDENGKTVLDRVPVYIRNDFKGPLTAILQRPSGEFYNALMKLKGATMSVIMYSPLIHNAVEWGRALPLMPGKVATLRVYTDGNRWRNDPKMMEQATRDGMAPIGGRGYVQDISDVMNEAASLAPGRGLSAAAIRHVGNLVNAPRTAEHINSAFDKFGDIWHNKLLWDRVADLQMGIYGHMRQHAKAKFLKKYGDSMTPEQAETAAGIVAAHLANRYAGALPIEAMSKLGRQAANFLFFSRTFTFGNLGVIKDAITGLPRDTKAQIEAAAGRIARDAATSYGRKQAWKAILLDIVLGAVSVSIINDIFDWLNDHDDKSPMAKGAGIGAGAGAAVGLLGGPLGAAVGAVWGGLAGAAAVAESSAEIQQGYVRRMKAFLQHAKENPWDLINFPDALERLSSAGDHEEGRKNKVLVGYEKDGTAIYARLPTGKMADEFGGWLFSPLQMIYKKGGTIIKPLIDVVRNQDDNGRPLYDPTDQSLKGMAKDIGIVAGHLLGAQVPLDSFNSAVDAVRGGEGSKTSALKALGPLGGVTFSKGYPGGPAMGDAAAARRRNDLEIQQAMPGIRDMIKNDHVEEAFKALLDLGMDRKLARWRIMHTLMPSRMSAKQQQQLNRIMTPEDRAQYELHRSAP